MKQCPFCAEEIQSEAIKCRHCNEFLDADSGRKETRWYHSTGMVILAIITMGPLALPLILKHPRYSKTTKIVISIIILAITIWSFLVLKHVYDRVIQELQQLHQLGL